MTARHPPWPPRALRLPHRKVEVAPDGLSPPVAATPYRLPLDALALGSRPHPENPFIRRNPPEHVETLKSKGAEWVCVHPALGGMGYVIVS
jgi:hypothetical protein